MRGQWKAKVRGKGRSGKGRDDWEVREEGNFDPSDVLWGAFKCLAGLCAGCLHVCVCACLW